MATVISMTMRDGRRSEISVQASDRGVVVTFERPGSATLGVGLTAAQARLLADALRAEAG